MGSYFDSFNKSRLDSFVESPVGARGGIFGDLNVGGAFTDGLFSWDDASFSVLGTGTNDDVNALLAWRGGLALGGLFSSAGGVSNTNRIAIWGGSNYRALGTGLGGAGSPSPFGFTEYLGNLIIAGDFTTAGGASIQYVVGWNGANYFALAGATDIGVTCRDVFVFNGDLYLCGQFQILGGEVSDFVTRLSGSTWIDLETGINGRVTRMIEFQNNLYFTGQFTEVNDTTGNRIGFFTGSTWTTTESSGLSGEGKALAIFEDKLIVAGRFTSAGGGTVNNIAAWDGSAWFTLGSGITGGSQTVEALIVRDGKLYCTGSFTTAGGNAAARIAVWDGTDWAALSSGLLTTGFALAVFS